MTRKLGIRYLWIDALCIIQDSEGGGDWLTESSRMAEVYKFAYLNLTASDSVDGHGGLYRSRDNPLCGQALIVAMTIHGYPSNLVFFPKEHDPDILSSFPVASRGWIFRA